MSKRPGRPKKYSTDERARMRLHKQAGWSHRQIAEVFGCSSATVSRIINSPAWTDGQTYTPKPMPVPPNDADLPGEEWRDIPGYEDCYQASDLGRIRRIRSRGGEPIKRVLKVNKNRAGYHQYVLSREAATTHWYGHRLVYMTFVGDIPPNREIDHINRDRGDNRPENLRLLTRQENMQFRHKRGADNANAKLTWEEVEEIRALAASPQITQAWLSETYNVSRATLCRIVNHQSYKR